MMAVYHRTERLDTIIAAGFFDDHELAVSVDGDLLEVTGVRVSASRPVWASSSEIVLELEIPAGLFVRHEWVTGEAMIPADKLNGYLATARAFVQPEELA